VSCFLALGYLLMPAASTPLVLNVPIVSLGPGGLACGAAAGGVLEVQWHWAGGPLTAITGTITAIVLD
jgi:hypothetical protein